MRDGETWRLPTKTIADKEQSFEEIYWWLRGVGEEAQRQAIRRLAEAHHIDLSAQCRAMIMSWDELRNMAADPLVHIGAHTKDHFAVAKLLDKEAMEQMVGSADRIAQELGKRPVHFAYPYGDPASAGPAISRSPRTPASKRPLPRARACCIRTKDHLTALPRVSMNGDYQSLAYTALYLSGAPFALWNGFQQVNAA
jgi:peptidoglycan/xylan/chitin deacetylase (PgdA/CDA1 family)